MLRSASVGYRRDAILDNRTLDAMQRPERRILSSSFGKTVKQQGSRKEEEPCLHSPPRLMD
jgi:hypothetical protein